MAKEFNLSRTSYAQYESGSRVPDMATLIEMANFFGVKLDALLNADDKALISNVLLYSSMTQIEHELLETFAALSDYSKGKLLERAYILHEEENQFLKDLDYNPEKSKKVEMYRIKISISTYRTQGAITFKVLSLKHTEISASRYFLCYKEKPQTELWLNENIYQ